MKITELIKENGGFILSEATLKVSDLLCASYGFIEANVDSVPKFPEWFHTVHDWVEAYDWDVLSDLLDYGKAIDFFGTVLTNPDLQEEASYLFNEDVFNYFNEISPPCYHFSSHEGDGACFGWWKNTDD
jgi:hypothetical protein